jgi:hypothetical protein
MRTAILIGAATLFAGIATAAFAADNKMGASPMAGDHMGSMMMIKAGETVAIMPDGHMGTVMSDAMHADAMMKMAKPISHCMMMMMGKDGKMYMVDTSSHDSMMSCESMAK